MVLSGFIPPEARDRRPALEYVRFDVPAGVLGLHIAYRHDEGHTIDLGLVDPTIDAFPSRNGFRGWSGGARRSVYVGARSATPGYLAGAIVPGVWHIVLGLAALGANGCAYEIEIEFEVDGMPGAGEPGEVYRLSGDPGVAAGSGRRLAGDVRAGMRESETEPPGSGADRGARRRADGDRPGRWYRGDLQTHTFHSDAGGSLDELAAAAARRSLDFLAVTDHNTSSQNLLLESRAHPGFIPGEELTTYFGHANVWGLVDWVDFRAGGADDIDRLIEHVHERGGLFSVNHPKAIPNCIGCNWELAFPVGADCIEAWQGPWYFRNWESLTRYDRYLRSGNRATLVGGSDRHQPAGIDNDPPELRVGSPTTWVFAHGSDSQSLLEALRAGRVCVTESPDGPVIDLQFVGIDGETTGMGSVAGTRSGALVARIRGAARGDTLRLVGGDGVLASWAISKRDSQYSLEMETSTRFVRAEVVNPDTEGAISRFRAVLPTEMHAAAAPFLAEAAGHPVRRALSNPVYFA